MVLGTGIHLMPFTFLTDSHTHTHTHKHTAAHTHPYASYTCMI